MSTEMLEKLHVVNYGRQHAPLRINSIFHSNQKHVENYTKYAILKTTQNMLFWKLHKIC